VNEKDAVVPFTASLAVPDTRLSRSTVSRAGGQVLSGAGSDLSPKSIFDNGVIAAPGNDQPFRRYFFW